MMPILQPGTREALRTKHEPNLKKRRAGKRTHRMLRAATYSALCAKIARHTVFRVDLYAQMSSYYRSLVDTPFGRRLLFITQDLDADGYLVEPP